MSNKLKTIESEDETTYLLIDENENEIMNIKEDSGYEIIEVFEEEGGFFSASYYDSYENEMFVLFDNAGKDIFYGITGIQKFISNKNEFILTIDSLSQENIDHSFNAEDEILWCVINKKGDFICHPQKNSISYSEDENKYLLD